MKRLFLINRKGGKRGQSLVELALVLLILALILVGVIEYGFVLNNYLHVLDASREGARFSSNSVPFTSIYDPVTKTNKLYPSIPNEGFYVQTVAQVAQVLEPLLLQPSLDPNSSDDVVISVFSESYTGTGPYGGYTIERFPNGSGWSLCQNFNQVENWFHGLTPPQSVPTDLDRGWSGNCVHRNSRFSAGDIQTRLDSSAPGTGILLVEIFYHYHQIMKLPVVTAVVPDPINVFTYSIMPIGSAEPTPTP